MKFDCGDGTCINISKVRNCIKDCKDGSDELCGANQTLCDTELDPCEQNVTCGQCVSSLLANITCRDRICKCTSQFNHSSFLG